MEIGVDPFLFLVVPERHVVSQGDPDPPLQSLHSPFVVMAAEGPSKDFQKFVKREPNVRIGEVVFHPGDLDQRQDDFRIRRHRQPKIIRASDGQQTVGSFVLNRFDVRRSPITEQSDRELGEVHLVSTDVFSEFVVHGREVDHRSGLLFHENGTVLVIFDALALVFYHIRTVITP